MSMNTIPVVAKALTTGQAVTGWLLILSGLIFVVGGMLYAGRAIWKWPSAGTPVYLRWERGSVMAALVTAVVGLTLLERMLEAAGDQLFAPAGMVIFLTGSVIVLTAEAFSLSRQEWVYAPIVVFVVLAFLGQALFGAAILSTGLLPGWVGWMTILWNLGCLVVVPIVKPKEIYYPWLHYVAPLLIGISLLSKG